ncbi:hypothetical protein F5Y12DRAFT_747730 [Xylaria sp. FL1777]|nr:hypothetical protein F5Y12DRAFT_747730 [Xylaria sp. FL1777]
MHRTPPRYMMLLLLSRRGFGYPTSLPKPETRDASLPRNLHTYVLEGCSKTLGTTSGDSLLRSIARRRSTNLPSRVTQRPARWSHISARVSLETGARCVLRRERERESWLGAIATLETSSWLLRAAKCLDEQSGGRAGQIGTFGVQWLRGSAAQLCYSISPSPALGCLGCIVCGFPAGV